MFVKSFNEVGIVHLYFEKQKQIDCKDMFLIKQLLT